MIKRIHASLLAIAIALAAITFVGGKFEEAVTAAPPAAMDMLASLPASDFVMYVDTQRLLTDAVPNLLSSNPALTAKMNAELDKLRDKEGVDLRLLDGVAIGLRFAPSTPNKVHFVAVGRGRFEADKVIAAIIKDEQNKGKSLPQEQQYEGRTIYIEPAPITQKKTYQGKKRTRRRKSARKSNHAQNQKKTPSRTPFAMTALDSNAIAFGDLEGVRAAIDASAGRGRVDEELVALATRNANAVVGFSGSVPASLMQTFGAQGNSDPTVKLFSSIKGFYGSVGTVGNDLETLLSLRTETADQARDLSKVLDVLKMMGGDKSLALPGTGVIVSPSSLLKNLTITAEGNEVLVSFKLTQAEIAPFLQGLPGARPTQ